MNSNSSNQMNQNQYQHFITQQQMLSQQMAQQQNNGGNSLELSLLENEIEKISSKYQLTSSQQSLPFPFNNTQKTMNSNTKNENNMGLLSNRSGSMKRDNSVSKNILSASKQLNQNSSQNTGGNFNFNNRLENTLNLNDQSQSIYQQQTHMLPLQINPQQQEQYQQQSMIQNYNMTTNNLQQLQTSKININDQQPLTESSNNDYQFQINNAQMNNGSLPNMASAVKSPSVLTFGNTMNNNSSNTSSIITNVSNGNLKTTLQGQQNIPDLINPLSDLTLNKQGQVPKPKDQKTNNSKINPKDLSNEELEYIIKTGKLPPRLNQQPQQQQNQPPTLINQNQQKLNSNFAQQNQQIINPSEQNGQIVLNHINHFPQPSLSSVTQSSTLNNSTISQFQQPLLQQQFSNLLNPNLQLQSSIMAQNKENFNEKSSGDYIHIKNYNSPRIINDYQASSLQSSTYQQPLKLSALQTSQIQPIQSQQTNNLQIQNTNSFLNQLDNSAISKILDISNLNPNSATIQSAQSQQYFGQTNLQTQLPILNNNQAQSQLSSNLNQTLNNNNQSVLNVTASTSQAASQALKALQDKVRQLESEKELLQDKLALTEKQSREQVQRQQLKLREETERAQKVELQLRDDLQLIKRQLESAEAEKMRHLEENSAERDQWRQQYKRIEEENLQLKRQLQESMEQYQNIEETIEDIRRREQQLRQRYEQAVDMEKERGVMIDQEMIEAKRRYEELKGKLKEKNKFLIKENRQLKEELEMVKNEKDREMNLLQRDVERWKRECEMLKEEMSILGTGHSEKSKHKKDKNQSKLPMQNLQGISSVNGITPKASQIIQQSKSRRRKSPAKQYSMDCSQNQQQIMLGRTINNQTLDSQLFQSIDNEQIQNQNKQNLELSQKDKPLNKKKTKKVSKNIQDSSKLDNKKDLNMNNLNQSVEKFREQVRNSIDTKGQNKVNKKRNGSNSHNKVVQADSLNKNISENKENNQFNQIQILSTHRRNDSALKSQNFSQEKQNSSSSKNGQKQTYTQNRRVSTSERKQSRSRSQPRAGNSQSATKSRKLQKSKVRNSSNNGKSPMNPKQLERTLIKGTLSQSNLISINTRKGRAESVELIDSSIMDNKLQESKEFIFIENNPTYRSNSSNQRDSSNMPIAVSQKSHNQYKRPSIESIGSIPNIQQNNFCGVSSTTSDYAAFLYSHQSSVDHQSLQGQSQNYTNINPYQVDGLSSQLPLNHNVSRSTNSSKPLDLNDFNSNLSQNLNGQSSMTNLQSNISPHSSQHQLLRDKQQQVDNEIFYLERQIFDYNQQYKTLLSQQSNALSTTSPRGQTQSPSNSSVNTAALNVQLRQIAQLLEEKSERLFDLKKQQQQMLLQSSYRIGSGLEYAVGGASVQKKIMSNSSSNQGLTQSHNPFI